MAKTFVCVFPPFLLICNDFILHFILHSSSYVNSLSFGTYVTYVHGFFSQSLSIDTSVEHGIYCKDYRNTIKSKEMVF